MRGRAGSVTEIPDLGKRAGNFAIRTLHPGYREENNTMHFRDRTDITELLILFSSIMKLGIVLFDSSREVKRNLRLFKQRKWENSRQAGSLDFTPEWSRHHFFKFSSVLCFFSESGLKVTIWTDTNFISVTEPARSTGLIWRGPRSGLDPTDVEQLS